MTSRYAILFAAFTVACGGATPGPETPGPAPVAEEEAGDEETSSDDESDDEPTEEELDAIDEAGGMDDVDEAEVDDEPHDPNRQRTVRYRMTPEGLEVEVEGLTLLVQAEVVRRAGAYGVRVNVEASAEGGDQSLLNPKTGPIMVATSVDRGGNIEKTGDKRDGDNELLIPDGDSVTFAREVPAKGQKAFRRGTTVKVMTGLWGTAKAGQKRRPLRKLAVVQLVVPARGKPRAFVNPPE